MGNTQCVLGVTGSGRCELTALGKFSLELWSNFLKLSCESLCPFGPRRAVDMWDAPVLAQLDARVWETLRLWKPCNWEHVDLACLVASEGGLAFGLLGPAGGIQEVSAENARSVVLHAIPTSSWPDASGGFVRKSLRETTTSGWVHAPARREVRAEEPRVLGLCASHVD